VFSAGSPATWRFSRSPLMRSARRAVEDIPAALPTASAAVLPVAATSSVAALDGRG
jgi:hypothetical protein